MNTKHYESQIDYLIEMTCNDVQKDGKQIKRNIIADILKNNQEIMDDDACKSILMHLENYMQQKIEESKKIGEIRISKGRDGRYAFYKTKTSTTRDMFAKQHKKTNNNEGIYLNFESNRKKGKYKREKIHLDINLQELRKKAEKMETVHFRVSTTLKRKLDNMCKNEGVSVSEFMRSILHEIF